MISGLRVTVLVGGSIAAYKTAELIRRLVKKGAKVHVVMSNAACRFITPLTMQTLSGHLVTTDLFDEAREAEINHIWLADQADLVVVAPATADLIAKAAAGIADDAPTTVLLATRAPVVFAPAMNVNMWQNPATESNVAKLRERGMYFVEPASGELACGWMGPGRLAETEDILSAIYYIRAPKDLVGSDVIVSAGPTREFLDPIRFISNRSSGKMGFALARVAQRRGAKVSLVSGPTALPPPNGVDFYPVTSARQMREKIFQLVEQPIGDLPGGGRPTSLVFMAAAVTDHMPVTTATEKLKQDGKTDYDLHLVPTPDILHELGERKSALQDSSGRVIKLIGFTAETADEETLLGWAREKLKRKRVDLMVGNSADEAFERDTNRVWLLDRSGRQEEVATADKHLVAAKIIAAALRV